jgi:UDP-GlcNAc:undecaprenyl-phosphate/decaprenyl-phosphate GlcNAc-1-phosphate transferase
MTFFFAFVISFVLAAVATPLAGKLGARLGLVAVPGGRRRHAGTIPVTGGVGLFAGFFATALGLYFFGPLKSEHIRPITGVLVGTAFVFLVGLADDKYEFKPGPQLIAQIVAACIAIAFTVWIQEVTLPIFGKQIFPWYLTYPLTIVWVVGMMNTVNLLDGLDGLASGVGAIAAILFAIHSYSVWKQADTPLYSLALAGACLGFLVFNFHPARLFLGSAGAMTLGFALATLSILTPARVATALLVMAIPIADAAFQLFDRWRRGQSPGQGDRGHLHYRLMDIGLSQRQIVIGYWLFCAVFGALALLISARIYKLIAMGVLGLMVVGVLVALSRKQKIQD